MRPTRTYSYSFIACFFLLLVFQIDVKSQNPDDKFRWQGLWYTGISGGFAHPTVKHTGSPLFSEVDMTTSNSFCFSLDAGYFFSKYFGVSAAIGVSPYLSQITLGSYSNSYDTVDSESEDYERRISGSNISEEQKIFFLEIPVMLNFQCPFSKSTGFYIQSGFSLSFPVSKKYTGKGIYSYSGYYPAYDVVLEDIGYEGFKNNVNNDVNGELHVKAINPGIIASGGFYFFLKKQYQISAGFFYKKILSDISAYTPEETFHLSTREGQVRSFMQAGEKTTAGSMGVLLSLRYYIK